MICFYKRICFFIYLLSFFFSNVSGQSDSLFIPIAAYWEKGDQYDFRVTKVKKTWHDRKITLDDSIQYIARFYVTHADSDSYTIEWSLKNYFFDLLKLPPEVFEKFSSYQTLRVLYKTDQFGVFREIQNWQEISRMINDLFEESALRSPEPQKLIESLKPMLSVYNTKRGIEQLLFKELLLMHFPFGKQYEKGRLYNYTEPIPVMMNSEPVTGNGVIFVRMSSQQARRCELVQRMEVFPDSAKKMLESYFHSLGMRPQSIPGTIASSTVKVNEENIYDYYYFPGIPEILTASRETLIDVLEDKVRQTDLMIIEHITQTTN